MKYIFLIILTFLIVDCSGSEDPPREREERFQSNDNNEEEEEKSSTSSTSSRRGSREGRLVLSDKEDTEDVKEYRPLDEDNFSGERCNRDRQCERKCGDIASGSGNIRDCERFPSDMVDLLKETYDQFQNVNSRNIGNIRISALGKLIDIGDDKLKRIIEREWNLSQLRDFLLFIASSSAAVEMFLEEDSNYSFFELILREMDIKAGDSISQVYEIFHYDFGLYTYTLLTHAQKENNEKFFDFTFDFLDDSDSGCGSTEDERQECVKRVLCKRKEIERRRGIACPTQGSQRRSRYCYIQGVEVWGYINQLEDDFEIDDNSLKNVLSGNTNLTQDFCEDFCDESGSNCDR